MKIRLLPVALLSALFLSACGKTEPSSTAASSSSAPPASTTTPASTGTPAATAATPAAGSAKSAGGRVIEITANDAMQFNVTTIEAKPGEDLKVVLTNIGTQPKQTMGHNWVLLKAGTDVMTFGTAGATTGAATDYIPPAMKDQVIAFVPVLGPKEKGEIAFKAPAAAGEYPFLCSFPGHFALMKGKLVVK